MPGATSIEVKGGKELERAFKKLRKEVLAEMRPALLRMARPVKEEAENLAYNNIENIGADWWQMRVGATVRGVYVAPKMKNRGGSPRPNFAGLLLVEAMQPAQDAHEHRLAAELETLVTVTAARNGFF